MSENIYWLFLVFVLTFYVIFNGRESERKDIEHLNKRKNLKSVDFDKVKRDDSKVVDLYFFDKNRAINWYRKKYGVSLAFSKKLVEEIVKDNKDV
ncbi:MAG: hypothetical protein CL577_08890 [Alteromonadaceae bacterium]|jgi:hypothetical protein|uniref:hypothetical protein n=1 Tax=Rheinheimera aquimaris TaxID=412437 RepID=UPI000C38DFE2|nr:hypothetical protein [Alteromonadaceae bacterium]|tara:strand:- start:8220 stop:8504 length:285 start_codon:yes stop_codon:yes gene_type:complete